MTKITTAIETEIRTDSTQRWGSGISVHELRTSAAASLMPPVQPAMALASAIQLKIESLPDWFSEKFDNPLSILQKCVAIHPSVKSTNIAAHAIGTAGFVFVVASALAERSILAVDEVANTTAIAILHETNQLFQDDDAQKTAFGYINRQNESALRMLKDIGLSLKGATALRQAWSSVGATSAAQYLTSTSNSHLRLCRAKYTSKILHLAHSVMHVCAPTTLRPTYSVACLAPWENISLACQSPKEAEGYFNAGIGLSGTGRLVPVKNMSRPPKDATVLGHHAMMETLVCRLIAKEICQLMDIEPIAAPERVIKLLVQGWIQRLFAPIA